MMIEIASVASNKLDSALDREEKKLAQATALRDSLWKQIEDARHEPLFSLPTEEYIALKVKHGNAEWEAARAAAHVRGYAGCYRGNLRTAWIREQYAMTIRKPTLAVVWRHWRNVLAARQAYADLAPTASTRHRIEAEIAIERTAGLYDLVNRAFDGRAERTHEQLLSLRVKPPSRPEPTPASKIQNRRRRKIGKGSAFDRPYQRAAS